MFCYFHSLAAALYAFNDRRKTASSRISPIKRGVVDSVDGSKVVCNPSRKVRTGANAMALGNVLAIPASRGGFICQKTRSGAEQNAVCMLIIR